MGISGVRNNRRLELAWKDKRVEILEIPLLHTCFGKHFEQAPKQVIDGANTDAKLSGHAKSRLWNSLTFLEFFDTSIDILFEKVFHSFTEHHFTFFFLVRKARQADHLAIVNVKGCSKDF